MNFLRSKMSENFIKARTEFNKNGPQKQTEVSKATGIEKSFISDMEDPDKTRIPGGDKIVTLANYYGVSCEFLLGITDVHSADIDMQKAIDFTGLSEKSISNIKNVYGYSTISCLNLLLENDSCIDFLNQFYDAAAAYRYTATKIYNNPASDLSHSLADYKKLDQLSEDIEYLREKQKAEKYETLETFFRLFDSVTCSNYHEKLCEKVIKEIKDIQKTILEGAENNGDK